MQVSNVAMRWPVSNAKARKETQLLAIAVRLVRACGRACRSAPALGRHRLVRPVWKGECQGSAASGDKILGILGWVNVTTSLWSWANSKFNLELAQWL
jgi:hypothetical protein